MTGTQQQTTSPNAGKYRFWIDFGPLLVFFLVNYKWGIYYATGSIMAVMPVAMLASWKLMGRVSNILWFSGALVLIFGGLTIYLQDERFIKIKPTILFAVFSVVLLVGLRRGNALLKYLFEGAFPPMNDRGWFLLTRNYAFFMLFKAALNEAVWRNVSTDTWVSVKVWGFTALTFAFILTQMPMMMRHAKSEGKTPLDSNH
jgi:intracellular septation protein